MTKEFKVKRQSDEQTVYVLESSMGGSTTAGAVASIPMEMGAVQQRQPSAVKKAVTRIPPKVVPAGKGKGSDPESRSAKKDMAKLGESLDYTEDSGSHYEQEMSMAQSELFSAAKNAMHLLKLLQSETELEAWQQSKITKAADYLDAVYKSIDYDVSGHDEDTMEAHGHSRKQQAAIAINKRSMDESVDVNAIRKQIKELTNRKYNAEAVLKQAEVITGEIQYAKQANETIDQLKELANTLGIDELEFNYHESIISDAAKNLAQAVNNTESVFEEHIQKLDFKIEDLQNEIDYPDEENMVEGNLGINYDGYFTSLTEQMDALLTEKKTPSKSKKPNPYAIGMAAAKKAAGYGKKPAHDLPKSVVVKGHEIAKKIKSGKK